MRATRAYIAGFGTAGSVLAGCAVLFVVASAVVAFNGWPKIAAQAAPVALQLDAPAQCAGIAGRSSAGAAARAATAAAPAAPLARPGPARGRRPGAPGRRRPATGGGTLGPRTGASGSGQPGAGSGAAGGSGSSASGTPTRGGGGSGSGRCRRRQRRRRERHRRRRQGHHGDRACHSRDSSGQRHRAQPATRPVRPARSIRSAGVPVTPPARSQARSAAPSPRWAARSPDDRRGPVPSARCRNRRLTACSSSSCWTER